MMEEYKKREEAELEAIKELASGIATDFDNFTRASEMLHCVGCGGIMEGEPLICQDCYSKNAADKHCMNCEEDKPSSQFHSSKSIICNDCFNGRPKELTIREALPIMLHGDTLAKLTEKHTEKSIALHKQMCSLENKLSILETSFTESCEYDDITLAELEETHSNIRGVEPDDVEEMELLSEKIRQLKQQMKESYTDHDTAVKKLTQDIATLAKTEEKLKAKFEEDKSKYSARTNEVMLVQKMIHDGSFTRQEIMNELAEQLNNIELKTSLHKLDGLFKQTGICSFGLKKVETRIRKGEEVNVKLIRPSENPVDAFVNRYIIVETEQDDDEEEPTINLKKKIKAGDLQQKYEVFIGKTVSPKIFAQTVGAVLAEKGIVKKPICKTNWYLGCSFKKDDEEDEDDV